MTDFANFETWRQRLEAIIEQATRVAQENDVNAILAVNRDFTDFIINSQPNSGEIVALDEIAGRARADLIQSAIQDRIIALSQRGAELASLTKRLRIEAAANEAAAALIGLTAATRAVTQLTESIKSLGDLKDSLQGDGPALQKVEAMIAAVQKVRDALEKAP